ncbi:MAG: hypothetical protein CME65_09360 [Halobacteriovoraceae bacterium]|nr:hypothetical protein [Halobacteriovoraceae bacterium]
MKKLAGLFIILIFSQAASAYVISRADSGAEVKWRRSNKNLTLFVNPAPASTDIELDISNSSLNSLGMSESEYITFRMMEIVEEATSEWNSISSYSLNPVYNTSGTASFSDSANSIIFTNDFSFFSSGVLAVTVLSFNSTSGTINSGDILINQSVSNFVELTVDETESSLDKAYLGDIITHELGHLLGLSHSEVVGSSMTFSVFKNQHTLHSDDHAAINHSYGQNNYSGLIQGQVVADNGDGVFGAHVQLISLINNEVVQGQLTDENGDFSFEVEDSNESYSLLVSPVKYLTALPDYYQNVKTDYCNQEVFVPSFFQGCGGRSKSRPQQLSPESLGGTIDLGVVTIRCDENLSSPYLANKYTDNNAPIDLQLYNGQTNASFVGMFLSSEISKGISGDGDQFEFDLSDVNATGDVLRVSVMSTGLGSNFSLITDVTQGSASTVRTTALTDETGKLITDYEIDFNLSNDTSENTFMITIYPQQLTTSQSYEILSSPNELANSNNLYHLVVSVGSYVSGEFVPTQIIDSYPYEDNNNCLEGTLSHNSQPYTPLSTAADDALGSESAAFSCATIDIDPGDDGPTGPMSFVIGLMLAVMLTRFKHYFLSKA